ncbi:LOW QUALITY PROTEIN: flavonoid 3'-monooxygenase CYP75B137-like [Ricinus communis]|uniref:LOW QUALITY PROTEIN: flavonoid 3'-monooxygenase CYP75B137-like n=1 Tax=Ricinus communis TaxID=3988 RepID=UPI00201AC0C4|nr:LOW QUALITY PROTEIN: flavonoid 3'-monooxygenase CYP75B137-like [Ricinus communis]
MSTTRVAATIVAAFLIIFWYSWLMNKSKTISPPLPPGPRGLPLVGNLPFVEPEFHRYFAKLSEIYGPIFKLQLGRKTCIVIGSNFLAKQILKGRDAIFANRDPPVVALAATYGGLDIAWRPNSEGWRKLRKVCVREMMSNTTLDACYMLRRRELRKMVKEVYEKVGSPVNIGEQIFLTILNIILSMLWGEALHDKDRKGIGVELQQAVLEIVELLGKPNISDLYAALAKLDLQGIESKINKLRQWFDTIFESVIADHNYVDQAKSKISKEFLQFLLEHMKQGDNKSTFSITELKALFMDIIVAGTDTKSTTVEWAMAEILKHPEVMAKIHEELERVVGNNNIVEESQLPELPYLEAVIKETLRLHPPIPLLIPHSPSISCTVAEYTIPKGLRVFFNVWEIQRNPDAWNDPLEFQPDRFLKEAGKSDYWGNDFNFLPFGSGRRVCAGIPLADRMVKHALATLLHSFDWKLEEGTELDLTEKFGIVLKKMTPLVCIPTAKLSTAESYC